jgi:hypothetical protein
MVQLHVIILSRKCPGRENEVICYSLTNIKCSVAKNMKKYLTVICISMKLFF